MKKALALILALSLCCGTLVSCGNKSSDSSNDKNAQTESNKENQNDSSLAESESSEDLYPASTTQIDITQGATENMLKRSVLNEGDVSRLAEKLNYAVENKKEITKIAFLGDSITQGSSTTSSQNQYVNQFKSWWETNISYYVDVTNAGIGATDSYTGVHRVQRDVLDLNPDIIFIEFINDIDNEFYKNCMDSLIRKCMSQENNPAVVLVEMTMEDGTSPQNVHSEIAKSYDIPIISYHDAIMPEIESGSIIWSDISPDNIHPNDKGHVLLGELLTNFVSSVKDNLANVETASTSFDAESPTGDLYKDAILGERSNVTMVDEGTFTEVATFQKFNDGWATTAGGSITFEMEFKNLGMLYLKTIDGESGSITINIDGQDLMPVDGNFPNGWGNWAKSEELFTSEEKAKHTVTVTVNDGDAKNFQILSWLIS